MSDQTPAATKPKVKIERNRQDLKKTVKKVKAKQSAFLLTINTNQRYKDDDKNIKNDIEVFESVINQILENIDNYVKLPEGVTWNNDTIEDVSIKYTIEKGQKKNCLHVHIFLVFKHHTKVLLDYDKIRSKIKTDLGLNDIFMQNKLVRNSGAFNIEEYLDKLV